MAASRREQPPLSLRLPPPSLLPDRPPIAALFLIDFDVKAGYTIVWKQSVPGLELEGAVEYKSLPSGLHTVQEDLVYFVHDAGYAGLSAFVNARTDDEGARHARMIAVGVLVPLSYGRLGRAWRHAEGLRDMARRLSADRTETHVLEKYWLENNSKGEGRDPQLSSLESPLNSPSISFRAVRSGHGRGHTRKRSASDGTALIPPGHRLSPFHPAWSLTALLDTFGPLIFPIYRAALLRKRILIATHAPVHEVCNFVYDISILANIPLSVFDIIDPSAPAQRLRPLFTIGIHDIPFLMEDYAASKRASRAEEAVDESGTGWVACTTDSILAQKKDLWDVLITLPPAYAANAREKVWPAVETAEGHPVKATQRDLRRFRSLRAGLRRLVSAPPAEEESQRSTDAPPSTPRVVVAGRPSTSSGRSVLLDEDDPLLADATEKIVEPMTWAALAYSGFMWWASAGEQRHSQEAEEAANDDALLADLAPPMPQRSASMAASTSSGAMIDSVSSLTARRSTSAGAAGELPTLAPAAEQDDDRARAELAIITFFHRLTTQTLSVLADIVESSDEDDDEDLMLSSAGEDSEGRPDEALLRHPSEGGAGAGGEDGSGIRIHSEAVHRMGLDVWSPADAEFVREVTARYFARKAYVEGKGVRVCGLRVC